MSQVLILKGVDEIISVSRNKAVHLGNRVYSIESVKCVKLLVRAKQKRAMSILLAFACISILTNDGRRDRSSDCPDAETSNIAVNSGSPSPLA